MEEIVTVVEKYSGHPMINQALFSLQCLFQEFSMVYIHQAWKILNDIYIFSMLMLTLMAIIHYFSIVGANLSTNTLSCRAGYIYIYIYNMYFIYLFLPCIRASKSQGHFLELSKYLGLGIIISEHLASQPFESS